MSVPIDKNSITFISIVRSKESGEALEKAIATALPSVPFKTDFRLGFNKETGAGENLFDGYTRAGKEATTDILVFLHDDLEILGNVGLLDTLEERLRHKATGVVGVAGAKRLTKSVIWFDMDNRRDGQCVGLCFHPDKDRDSNSPIHVNVYGPYGRALVLDGVFLACRQDVFDAVGGFDVDYLEHGFELYDVDFTWRAAMLGGYVNYALPILLLHRSQGNTVGRESWDIARHRFLERYKTKLPHAVPDMLLPVENKEPGPPVLSQKEMLHEIKKAMRKQRMKNLPPGSRKHRRR